MLIGVWAVSSYFYRGEVEAGAMVSLPEELQAREAAARQQVEELQSEVAELVVRLDKAQADLSRLEITRKTVMQVLAELSAAEGMPEVEAHDAPEPKEIPAVVLVKSSLQGGSLPARPYAVAGTLRV
ncbi:hypothetical protein [Streptomyces sp. NPDC046925]|uniref:hypothetical protein n=1 Tax=Streptomyces sp. NPDC046925 TaxID=3155375 RepID=UPI0033ED4CD2